MKIVGESSHLPSDPAQISRHGLRQQMSGPLQRGQDTKVEVASLHLDKEHPRQDAVASRMLLARCEDQAPWRSLRPLTCVGAKASTPGQVALRSQEASRLGLKLSVIEANPRRIVIDDEKRVLEHERSMFELVRR